MKKKAAGIGLLIISLFYSAVSGVFAQENNIAEVHNRIETGDINIALKQYNPEGTIFKGGQVWTPGDKLEDVICIENQAKECWVRMSVKHDDVISLNGISEQWVFREPYWYYSKTLREGEKIIFSNELLFSEEVTEAVSGKVDSMEVTVEAIQAANFVPDFQGESPWGDQEAELCVHVKEDIELDKTRKYQELLLQMEGEAGKLIAAPDDFFTNLSELMPGDTQSDEITVYNVFNRDAELFFRTEDTEDMTEEQKELLEKLWLTIYNNNKLIYKGDLRSQELNREISLGTWKSGEKGKLKYTISMPAELKNEFAVRDAGIRWIFRTVIEEEPPKTGDDDWSTACFVLAIMSGVMGAWLLFQKKRSIE